MRATNRAVEGGRTSMWRERIFRLGPSSVAAGLRSRPWRLVAFIVLLYLAVPLLGMAVFWTHLEQTREETFANLGTVAEFKRRELELWLRTRTGDAEEVTTRAVLADLVTRWLAHGDVEAKHLVSERIGVLHTIKGFESVVLASPEGHVLVGFGRDQSISSATISGPLRQAAESGRVVRSAVYRDADGRTRIDFMAPLKRRVHDAHELVGVVVLRVDADAELFPMVARWPTRSASAETALIRRDGDAVVFMTPLRHRSGEPFSLRVPISEVDLPAAIFAREPGKQFTEGRDYRGVAVFAAQAPIGDGEWQAIVKIDRAEVVAPLVDLSKALAVQAAGAVTVVSLLLAMLWRAERRSHALDMAVQAAETDRFLARFFDMPFLGLALANRDRTLLHANSRLCEILGCSKEDLLRTSWMQWTHPDDRDASRAAYQHLVNGQESHLALQKRYVRKDGGIVAARLDIQVIRDADGAVDCFLVLVEDVSASRRAEIALRESEARYQAFMDNSADGIVIADPEGRILEINRMGEQILGYAKEQISSVVLRDLFPPQDWGLHAAALGECLATGHSEVRNAVAVRRDGSHVSLDIRAAMVQLESGPVVQGVFNDVSERQRQQRERRRAEEAHRSALVREVHHRIENNLQGVAGILRRLARSHPSLQGPITDAISRLQGIAVVHGIQGPAASGVPLCDLARRVAENTEALWQHPVSVEVECPHGGCMLADNEAVPMALVLNELLANAAKHGEEGSRVDLTARFDPDPPRARLTIRNKGWLPEGFSAELQMGFGDGLQLVSALLPRSGVEVRWEQDGAWVSVTLEVSPPVLAVEHQAEKASEFSC